MLYYFLDFYFQPLNITYFIGEIIYMHNIKIFKNYTGSESHSIMSNSMWPHGLYSPWNSSGQNSEVGSLFLLQWISIQGSNPGLLHCRWILYQLSHKVWKRINNTHLSQHVLNLNTSEIIVSIMLYTFPKFFFAKTHTCMHTYIQIHNCVCKIHIILSPKNKCWEYFY